MRIAILAACANTLALATIDVAPAYYRAAFESKSPTRIMDVGPEPATRLAQNIGEPIPGIDIVVKKNPPPIVKKKSKAGSGLPNNRSIAKGSHLPKQTSKTLPQRKRGSGTAQPSIFDQGTAGNLSSY